MPKYDVKKISFTPAKSDNQKRRWVLDDLETPMHNVAITRGAFVGIGPGGWAANHRHERHEILLALSGELYLIWRDAKGVRHEERMTSNDGKLHSYSISPWTPHLVENRSKTEIAVLHEWSDVIDEAEDLQGPNSLRSPKP